MSLGLLWLLLLVLALLPCRLKDDVAAGCAARGGDTAAVDGIDGPLAVTGLTEGGGAAEDPTSCAGCSIVRVDMMGLVGTA